MRVKTFTVPFAKVAAEATELDFGPDDYLVVRPLFGLPREEAAAFGDRIKSVEALAEEAQNLPTTDPKRQVADEAADTLILDIIRTACVEWHLEGPEGPIDMPGTRKALNTLPGGLAAALYPFLTRYRGEDPNPTTPR